MRIACPHCGERGIDEFSYGGDASRRRPNSTEMGQDWMDYVYLRDNPAGAYSELWQHTGGCRRWLIVQRDTRTHAIAAVSEA